MTLERDKGNCEKCDWCGLVIDNHDYDMVMTCATILSGDTTYERAVKFLHDRSQK